ncbi:MAG TPA: CDGSH iron-sulfur domain-containing protein [Melioribacteraceae bacterium]|nr:CDGSH iron-sulfur domain-containing protein [Melioribacteraceae bacterium]
MEKANIADNKPHVCEEKAGIYYWCACGKSKKQPYCDGSHKGSEFSPQKVSLDDNSKVAWCMCKQSSNPPFCDGSHKKL